MCVADAFSAAPGIAPQSGFRLQRAQPRLPDSLLSIVVAFFNEEQGIPAFFRALDGVAPRLDCELEFVCVNDGSRDNTLELLRRELAGGRNIRLLNLARNFGKEAAISAGLAYATGGAAIVMDADLQDPPSLIPEFVSKWREGYDVVYGVRACRKSDTLVKRIGARVFYETFARLTKIDIPPGAGDFRLLDRRVVIALLSLPERNRYMKGLYSWVGFRQIGVEYVRPARVAGKTGWSFLQLLNLAVDALTSFSIAPLRLASVAGFAVSLAGFAYAAFLVGRTLLFGVDSPGYASLMVAIIFLGGVQLCCVGVLGEYIGRLYTEAKGRPLYIIADIQERDLVARTAARPLGASPAEQKVSAAETESP